MLPDDIEVFVSAGIGTLAIQIDLQLGSKIGIRHRFWIQNNVHDVIDCFVVQIDYEVRVVQGF